MIRDTFFDVLGVTWPSLVIFLTIISIIRIGYLKTNHKKIIFYREAISLLFITYILLLFELVTMRDISIASGTNFVPFTEIFRYQFGSSMFLKQVVGNIVLFIPFGFFAAYYIKAKKITIMAIIILLSSLTIEIVQYYIGRSFDVDDIILNVVGGLTGYIIYYFFESIRDKLPNALKKDFLYNIITLILMLVIILYFFNFFEVGGL